jgi:hypothetical protein
MDNNEEPKRPIVPTATDAEIASAARQLGLITGGSAPTAPTAPNFRIGHVVQRLAHGRSHAVAVEIKHSRRHSTP